MHFSLKNIFHLMTVTGLYLSFIFSVFSCASKERDLNTAEGLFDYAKEFEKAERYEVALVKYADVKNKFPYSSLAVEAELAIADVHYKRESYPEAEVSYQNFRDLHPKYPKIDFVIFRIGMSYYQQLPETIDRDLSVAKDAIYHFSELIKLHPQSTYSVEAKTKRDQLYSRLVEKELYIADFYFREEKYASALRRYEQALLKYSGLGYDPRAHLGAAKSALKIKDSEKHATHVKALTEKFPNAEETKNLKEGLK